MLNPFSFRTAQVTFWTTSVYLSLLIPLILLNESVPPAPEYPAAAGVNLTEAWLDLATLTSAYHPYNSRRNGEVRDWLLFRIQDILRNNGVSWSTESLGASSREPTTTTMSLESNADVVVFDDLVANFTGSLGTLAPGTNIPSKSPGGQAAYFEGTNIIVYIRGTEDEKGKWWGAETGGNSGKGGTLINAHFDSVSTGFGATDDGMGVVSVLQVIKHFTTPGHRPKRGIVALLNNGEEDFLYGARAFGQSPLLPFVHTFLNLEGAGAGGRALLFRTSDQEVTSAYSSTDMPFGNVIGSDSFSLGFIRSQTDYVVLNGIYGQRGLDLAFFKPRARYHTNQDDTKHASKGSLWHMLSAALHTTTRLSGGLAGKFDGPRKDGAYDKAQNGHPTNGVWFDLLGKGFVLFNLRGMFAWSLTLLVVTPLILALVTFLLIRADKYYFFTTIVKVDDDPVAEPVSVKGLRGLFRFPLAFVFAVTLTFGAAFLLRKVNPFIVHSCKYSVWAMTLSLFYFAFWLIMRGASFVRPSALHRGYAHLWLFVLGWAILVGVTVLEDRFKISSGYFFVFFQSAVFLSTLITLVELFVLPTKTAWAEQERENTQSGNGLLASRRSNDLIAPSPGEAPSVAPRDEDTQEEDEDQVTGDETTPLVAGRTGQSNFRTTFATTYRRSISAFLDGAGRAKQKNKDPYKEEQSWSGNLPSWTWLLQFLLIGPFFIILAGQMGLTVTDAVHQTGSDGSSSLLPYLVIAASTVLLLLPVTPFIHRVPHHIPLFLLVIFVATLIYNLAAFPFSAENRFKVAFQQSIDLDTGATTNHFHGIDEYVRRVIAELPSSAGKPIHCDASTKQGLVRCSYDAATVAPNIGHAIDGSTSLRGAYADLITVNVTRGEGNKARIQIDAVDTKACFLSFDRTVSKLDVAGSSGWDARFGPYPDEGLGLIKLWRRDWDKTWEVDFEWEDKSESVAHMEHEYSVEGRHGEKDNAQLDDELKVRSVAMEGTVSCQWSDANVPGTIPALDEALWYSPVWTAITKSAEGLVEGKKRFQV
ncbi:hypothetical protein VTK73DRAFT_8196 [Phialemonium thermophilum]|uniref:Peptide hydrolase n=1 Tax=Phialemonium thermophilum TaxID=223376 RepID=A0ABR3XPY4_9PEZI